MKAREVNAQIERLGGEFLRQRGSHRVYRVTVEDASAQTTVPQHNGDIPTGTLRAIEKQLESVLGKGWLR
jgi:predicted RNA binding protein YcfA (HicA-like mRNA interferase family)